jgi:hypothetical protein
MNRVSKYSTNSSLYKENFNDGQQSSVIRPPIRNAYNTEFEFQEAVSIGIKYALDNNIKYINH